MDNGYPDKDQLLHSPTAVDIVETSITLSSSIAALDVESHGRINSLPIELLRLILYDVCAGSGPQPRLAIYSLDAQRQLLGVCHFWRDILIDTPDLWTPLRIVSYDDTVERFHRLLARLDVQLERTGSLMLDVLWRTRMPLDRNNELFALLARRAPFSQWRSLTIISCDNGGPMTDEMVLGMGDFRNLVSLELVTCAPDQLLRRVNDSVTSTLVKAKIGSFTMLLSQFNTELDSILQYISAIRLPNFYGNPPITLPAHITQLETYSIPNCEFTHITSLTVIGWIPLSQFNDQNFPKLEYLSTHFSGVDSSRATAIMLSRLTTLVVPGNIFEPLALMRLPKLRVLRIGAPNADLAKNSYSAGSASLRAAVAKREMELSPCDRLEINVPLPPGVLVQAVKKLGSKAKEVVWCMREAHEGWEVLRTLFLSSPTTLTTTTREEEMAAPQMQTLEIRTRLTGNEANERVWRAYMTQILEETRRRSLENIKTVWLSGETIVNRAEVSL